MKVWRYIGPTIGKGSVYECPECKGRCYETKAGPISNISEFVCKCGFKADAESCDVWSNEDELRLIREFTRRNNFMIDEINKVEELASVMYSYNMTSHDLAVELINNRDAVISVMTKFINLGDIK